MAARTPAAAAAQGKGRRGGRRPSWYHDRGIISVYSSNPREGGYIELAIHGPLWAVQGHMGHSHIYTLTKWNKTRYCWDLYHPPDAAFSAVLKFHSRYWWLYQNNLELFHRAWSSYPLYSSALIDSCNLTSLWNFAPQLYFLHVALLWKFVIICLKTLVQLYAGLQWDLDCQLHSYPCTHSKEGVTFHMPCKKVPIYVSHIFSSGSFS
jgi:hypothetical protein